MSFIAAAIIGGGASLGAAGLGLFGSLSASNTQASALKSALAQQQQMFGTAQNALSPYVTTGQNLAPTLQSLLTPGPNQNATLSQLPGFQFANTYGQIAAQNQGSTLGLGGNTLATGAQYATGLAQQNFSQYINPLLQTYQTGSGAAGSLAGAAQGFSGQMGSTLGSIGGAQAAGTLGATNALAGGLTGGANSFGTYSLFNSILGNNSANGVYGNGVGMGGNSPNLGYANYNNGQPVGIQGVGPFAQPNYT